MRVPKPWLRKQTKTWYVQIDGRQVALGKDKEAAMRKFHALMAGRRSGEVHRVDELFDAYLEFVQRNRAPETYQRYRKCLSDFNRSVPNKRIHDLKPHDVQRWLDTHSWGPTSQRNAIKTIKAALNWAVEGGLIGASPLARMKAPAATPREILVSEEQWAIVQKTAKPDLLDILTFLRETGARPQEARTIEAEHVRGDRIMLPKRDSKGGVYNRVIWLTEKAQAIIQRRMGDGKLFRTALGKPWSNHRLRQCCAEMKLSFPFVAYALRHTYITDALERGVDPITLANLVGHRDLSMIAKTYSHLIHRPDHLRDAARKATTSPTMSPTGGADAAPAD